MSELVQSQVKQNSRIVKILDSIEYLGNKLPSPPMIFIGMSVFIMIISAILASQNQYVLHPGTGDPVYVVNLLSLDSMATNMTSMVTRFTGFAPLGLVLVTMIGIGLADKTGYITTVIKKATLKIKPQYLTVSILFIALLANSAGDAGFIVLPPIAALAFMLAGRNPIIGIIVAYAGVAGGISANFMITLLDVLLAGITAEAVYMIDPELAATVNPTINWIFMAVSVILLLIVGTFTTEKIIAPRLERDGWDRPEELDNEVQITPQEIKGIKLANLGLFLYIAFLLFLAIAPIHNGYAFLSGSQGGLLDRDSVFLTGLVPIILVMFGLPGLIYGIVTGKIKSTHDMVKLVASALSEMGGYLVMVFTASQFIALFGMSNLAIVLAVNGAASITSIGLSGLGLFIAFIIFTAVTNLLISSASAQWLILSPIFVPIFLMLGYQPDAIQAAFRIGDSVTTIVGPLGSFLPLILALGMKYKKGFGLGSFIAAGFPLTIAFFLAWTGLFAVWFLFGLPFGV